MPKYSTLYTWKMANSILFQSSIVCTVIHLPFLIVYVYVNYLHSLFILTALCSSILNHGFTSEWFKWFDRSVMYVGFVITWYMTHTNNLKIMNVCIPVAYYLSKRHNSIPYHIVSHLLITAINICIMCGECSLMSNVPIHLLQ